MKQAEKTRVAADGKAYKWGGTTTEGFDCSGFTIYVFNEVYGPNTIQRVTADDLRTQGYFPAVSEDDAATGDLVFFSQSPGGSTAHHVGIVIDPANRWIGSQSSTGVAYVKFSSSYWKPRLLSYGRYVDLAVSSIVPLQAGSFASIINKMFSFK